MVKHKVVVKSVGGMYASGEEGVNTEGGKRCIDDMSNGRFAGAGQPGEPQHRGFVLHQIGAHRLANGLNLVMNIGGAAQREIDHARRDRNSYRLQRRKRLEFHLNPHVKITTS